MSTPPLIRYRSFFLHKEGNTPDEYEDAFAANLKTGRFAIADGATESSFAGLWAELLVEGFVASRKGESKQGWVGPLQDSWAKAVDSLNLEWFNEEKRAGGAYAAFLGLSLKKPVADQEGRWQAVAVGDCCMFQVRDQRLMCAYPVTRSAQFSNRPTLLGSRAVSNRDDALGDAKKRVGRWRSGDTLFLMSDAMAQWFLRCREARRRPWEILLNKFSDQQGDNALTAFVKELRQGKELANDDVTIAVIYF